ncbi:thiamine kinase [Erwiniaceae bacterium BAC15a-03b]|uniref:Thiamine kinase n=1 Tax=Winslowiella arboricola TaxID=2978220 RepID=A0A9J6PZ32_9GAMM|nr:thiamine kinase [Winslowiella arboricola]MCU5774684.1 thiamine kinase [Winslowiella arboricola]MCU5780164.1 thiamine kinase [Winslowiella arboricola]
MTYSIDPTLRQLIVRQFPAAQAAGCFSPLAGLTGLTAKVTVGQQQMLARRESSQPIPFVSRRREYRLLKRLASSGLTPQVYGHNPHWLLLEWLPGEVLDGSQIPQHLAELVAMLSRLHHQPLSGYRLQILPLLQRYWQLCRQRNIRWLRALQRLTCRGEPQPLRLAPLHMDIHAGNILQCGAQLRLIDWEYAGDGDIALELAAIIAANTLSGTLSGELVADYAHHNQIDCHELTQQIARWQPWLRVLMASWYQLRAEQSSDCHLQQLAADAWRAL